mgnify:CR=1 FL=1
MKHILNLSLFLAMMTCSLSTNAQKTFKLKDLISQQEGLTVANSSSVEMQAITPELSVIRQQYRLERNGSYFGKNNMPFYGESYSLAVKVSGGTYFTSDVVEPWKIDTDYTRDNASGNYKPSIYWTYQRPINETKYKAVNLEIKDESEYVKPVNAEKSLYLHTDAINDFGLSIDNTTENKKGTMIWAYSKTDIQDSAMAVVFQQSSFTIEAKEDSSLVEMTPSTPEKIIGGIFVTPKIEKGGRVQYLLSGVAVRNKSNGWSLQLLCIDDRITKSESSSSLTKTNDKKKSGSQKKK